jgi:hypothetical protein
MTSRRTLSTIALTVLALCALFASSANAELARQARADATASAFRAAKVNIPVRDPGPPPGAQVLNYKFGPMRIQPGQNLINVDLQKERPDVNGYIVGFRPGLVYAQNGKSPSVKVVHLHHAVWLVGDSLTSLKPTFAAGEEKTYFNAPSGFGWRYTTGQTWVLNHMIHDLVASPQNVYLTYTLYFIPDTAPEAANITPIDTQWMDVQGIKPYPVFNAIKGKGTKTRSGTTEFTYPNQAPNAYKADGIVRNRWVVDHDATLVSTAGHLHPGGLFTDLQLTRDGVTKTIFRSRANYFEPAGSVSWDVAMSATTAESSGSSLARKPTASSPSSFAMPKCCCEMSASVQCVPTDVSTAKSGDLVTIVVTASCDSNRLSPALFFGGRDIAIRTTMAKE